MWHVKNLYVEVNMYVTLWSYLLTHVTQRRHKWQEGGVESVTYYKKLNEENYFHFILKLLF